MLIKLPDKSQVGKPGLVLATPGWYTEAEGLLQGQPGPPCDMSKEYCSTDTGIMPGAQQETPLGKGNLPRPNPVEHSCTSLRNTTAQT